LIRAVAGHFKHGICALSLATEGLTVQVVRVEFVDLLNDGIRVHVNLNRFFDFSQQVPPLWDLASKSQDGTGDLIDE